MSCHPPRDVSTSASASGSPKGTSTSASWVAAAPVSAAASSSTSSPPTSTSASPSSSSSTSVGTAGPLLLRFPFISRPSPPKRLFLPAEGGAFEGLLAAEGGAGGIDLVDSIDLPETAETLLSAVSLRGLVVGAGVDCTETVDNRLLWAASSSACSSAAASSGAWVGAIFAGGEGSLAAGGGSLAAGGGSLAVGGGGLVAGGGSLATAGVFRVDAAANTLAVLWSAPDRRCLEGGRRP